MEIRFPMWLRVVDRPGATVFASLAGLEAFSRALVAGVIPIIAYEMLETARAVSVAYTVIGLIAMLASFLVPLLLRAVRRKWVFTVGCLCMVVGPVLMAVADTATYLAGLQLRALAVVCVNIALNLYILDYIRRTEFVKAEPRRLAFMGVAWSTGPGLGIFLNSTYGMWAVAVPSAAFALITLGFFWYLRMQENPAVAPAKRKPPMPWDNIRRYMAQPRLRLAWFITFARSTFWTTFFVYPAIYIAREGGSAFVTAAMLTAGQALLFAAPLFGRIGARYGIRRVIIWSFVGCGGMSLLAGLVHPSPEMIAVMFFFATIGSVALDALGNIPFLRFVHAHERSEMTSVFRTYIEASQLLPSALYAVILTVAPIEGVFIAMGLYLLFTAWLARYLPRRL